MIEYSNRCYQCFGSVCGRCVILKERYSDPDKCPFFKSSTEITREDIEKELSSYHMARWESD